jgi:hypothetical protein
MDMVVASSSCDDPSSASQCINLGYRTIVSRRSQNWTILPCLFIAWVWKMYLYLLCKLCLSVYLLRLSMVLPFEPFRRPWKPGGFRAAGPQEPIILGGSSDAELESSDSEEIDGWDRCGEKRALGRPLGRPLGLPQLCPRFHHVSPFHPFLDEIWIYHDLSLSFLGVKNEELSSKNKEKCHSFKMLTSRTSTLHTRWKLRTTD